jgi:hypothetical protein
MAKVVTQSQKTQAKHYDPFISHALGLVQYLRTIGYSAWIEDTNGNEVRRKGPKHGDQVSSRGCTLLLMQLAATHQAPGDVGCLQRRAFGW